MSPVAPCLALVACLLVGCGPELEGPPLVEPTHDAEARARIVSLPDGGEGDEACPAGFEARDGACADIDECALPNACTRPGYPCVQTEPPGYSCLGERAEWPMPDPVPGGRTPPSYTLRDGDTPHAEDDVVRDDVTGLDWQRQAGPTLFSHAEAARYCSDLSLGGTREWRLPSKIELESLVNLAAPQPSHALPSLMILSGRFAMQGRQSTTWSASRDARRAGHAFYLHEQHGLVDSAPVTALADARCVRTYRAPTASTPEARYVASLPGVVEDTRTDLRWQASPDDAPRTYPEALAYCAALTLADATDWRVPTPNELLTLFDPSSLAEAALSSVLTHVEGRAPAYWSSVPSGPSIRNPSVLFSWAVHYGFGSAVSEVQSSLSLVRCVR